MSPPLSIRPDEVDEGVSRYVAAAEAAIPDIRALAND
jgi:hypothetical protein